MALAKTIRRQREALGYSQEGFAEEIGAGRSYYWRLEKGVVNMRITKLDNIAKGLQTTASELLRQAEELKQKS